MAAVINTNYLSLVAQNNLNNSQSALGSAIERLSSGLRINSAKDDAAGQAIANRFTANVNGLTQAARNANDGISIAQTTEGALNEINNNLQRIRELTVQAQNGTNSQSDLDSIQAEIQQRLDEIDRVSAQTQFNGVNVLAKDQSLSIQVGANDGQTININLKGITAKSLGLDGFNVNGKGTTQNRTATVSDLVAAKGLDNGDNTYTVKTTFDAVTTDQAFAKLKDGDTVSVAGGTAVEYTYDAAKGNFTFTNTLSTASAADVSAAAEKYLPSTGTVTGTYDATNGAVATFEVDSSGKLTINGQKAYLTDDGLLTTNSTAASPSQASLEDLFAKGVGSVAGSSLTIGGTKYTNDGTKVTFQDTATKDTVLNAVKSNTVAGSKITLKDGLLTAQITFGSDGKSSDTYVDNDGEFTTTKTFDTTYAVDVDTGTVTVKSTASSVAGTKYEETVGATVYVGSNGKLTTETTSKGDLTADPLAALDKALSSVDSLRSDLGAIQNRFESTIANLNNTVNNLSDARSRIQDADYATEVSNMTRAQILQQAGTAVLAQANQVPQTVLSLLR
ncbi:FliC/FljB family flagellin [Bordetella genomosp. 9]|uniref:Flagellin n=1 Tax=Bordetella genomosp. 9 TaxID=1416803 RepID=A0A1W6Z1I1_9BORD|nr:FliC/FljB family flagellin [Bordetella genomosp. 9]ARP86969.1 flagellin [Bordetella genomosp. 9]